MKVTGAFNDREDSRGAVDVGGLEVISGPTAVGKTEYALMRARQTGAEILSCDSLLVYRGMDIGTAKPGAAERGAVPHHGIDLVGPAETFSVDDYVRYALGIVADCQQRGVPLIVVGGSGFYLRAFFAPVVDRHQVPPAVRLEAAAILEKGGLAAALERLRLLNPDGLGALDSANPRRVVNALARCMASGRTIIDLQREFAALPSPFARFRPTLTVLERDPEDLARRIEIRTAAMLRGGLVEEVQQLLACGLASNPSGRAAIGYREVIEWLQTGGRQDDLASLEAAICANTRKLVKKQRNWFRRHLPVDKVFCLGAN